MKARIRKQMRETLLSMPVDIAAAKSRAACRHILQLREFQSANVVMIYLPIPGEVDTTTLSLAAWRQDKNVLAPRVSWQQKHMMAVEIYSLDNGIIEGEYGVREPRQGEPWPVSDIDFVIVPAMAYDRRGNRLGRGGGFYDRFLAEPGMRAVLCGLAFDEQVVDELPVEPNDRPVTILATDKELLRFDRPGQL